MAKKPVVLKKVLAKSKVKPKTAKFPKIRGFSR